MRVEFMRTMGPARVDLKNFPQSVDLSSDLAFGGNLVKYSRQLELFDVYPDVVCDLVDRYNCVIYTLNNVLSSYEFWHTGYASFRIEGHELEDKCNLSSVRKAIIYVVYRKHNNGPNDPANSSGYFNHGVAS